MSPDEWKMYVRQPSRRARAVCRALHFARRLACVHLARLPAMKVIFS